MTDYMKVTSDSIRVADTNLAEQIINEYRSPGELEHGMHTEHIHINGNWVFVVEHESNIEPGDSFVPPGDTLHFLADIARIATDSSLPFTITEVCQGALDQHPGLTRYVVDRTTITRRTDSGNETTWQISDYGIVTDKETPTETRSDR